MGLSQGSSGFGTLLQRGDGGVGAGAKASATLGTSNSQLIIRWGTAGTVGNGKTVEVVVSGTNTPLSVTVSQTAVVINVETDGADAAASTVNDVIAALQSNATFDQYWEADDGVGDGTGILAAATETALATGTDGTEAFTTIAEVTNISGPEFQLETIEATHMESTDGFREYLASLRDSGEVSFDLNFLPGNANQKGLTDDLVAGVRRNFKIIWTDAASTPFEFAGFVTSFSANAQIDDKLSASATIKVTGPITWGS